MDVVGPLGKPSEIENYRLMCVVGGGVGTAAAYPIARAFKEAGSKVISIIGAKTANLLILEDKIAEISDEVYISTDDGTKGQKGFVSDALKNLIDKGYNFNVVYAIAHSHDAALPKLQDPTKIKTIVSLNPIMVDAWACAEHAESQSAAVQSLAAWMVQILMLTKSTLTS